MRATERQGRLARNTLYNALGFGLPVLVAIAAMPVLARALDAASFGLLALAWLVHGYANELGFGRATTRFAAAVGGDDPARLRAVVWTTLALQTAVGLSAGLALALAAPVLAHAVLRIPDGLTADAIRAFLWLGATVPVIVAAASVRGLLEALQRFDLVNAVRGPATAAGFALPLAGVVAGWSVSSLVGLLFVSRAAALVAYAVLAVRSVPGLARPSFAAGQVRELASYGAWSSLSGLLAPLLIYLDRILLGVLVSMAAVAYYAAPYEVVARLLIVPASLVAALFPELSRLHTRGDADRIGEIAARAMRYTLLAVAPAGVLLVACASDLLRLWLGEAYALEGSTALQVLAVGIVINAVAHVPVTVLQGIGRPDLPARLQLLEVPLHAAAAVLCIRMWGITGAAAAYTLRVSLDAVLLLFAQSRLVTGSARAVRTERVMPVAAGFAALLLAAVLASLVADPILRLAAAAVVVGGGVLAAWRYGVRGTDRERIARLVAPVRVV
jgi:O-antigen/teichoic acid export membrane protein